MSGSLGDRRLPGVLIVDQDGEVRQMLAHWLRRQGFEVWTAPGAAEAADICKVEAIHLAFIEINLKGCDGPGVFQQLRGLRPELAACFMGSHFGLFSKAQLLQLGTVIIKPFSLFDLSPLLRNFVISSAHAPAH